MQRDCITLDEVKSKATLVANERCIALGAFGWGEGGKGALLMTVHCTIKCTIIHTVLKQRTLRMGSMI